MNHPGDPLSSSATMPLRSSSTPTSTSTRRHIHAWYAYAFAAEVFSACALAIFLPITLEKVARDVGFAGPDWDRPCGIPEGGGGGGGDHAQVGDGAGGVGGEEVCRVQVLGLWVDTASFSMYVKSIAVALQALFIVTVGPIADSHTWRKPLLATFASIGALSGILFVLLPTGKTWVPLVVALLTILGNVGYAVGIVCSNAYLPDLAREDERERVGVLGQVALGSGDDQALTMPEQSERDEVEPLLSQPEIAGIPISISPISPTDVAFAATARDTSHLVTTTPTIPDANLPDDPNSLSLTTSRISSTGTAIGFFSGVAVLALLLLPVSLMGGSTASLRLAIALSGVWWAVWSVPAVWGLPGRVDRVGSASLGEGVGMVGHKDTNEDEGWKWGDGWRRVGRMIRWKETKRLKNLFVFLLTWIFLSDGFHTTTYTAILYASSHLHMPPSAIILIGILVQLSAVISSLLTPRFQRSKGWTNAQVLVRIAIAGGVLPVYACLGLVLPFGGLRTEGEMYAAAVWFGILYGPFNSYSRAVYAELIPPGHESSFFSLFALTDKSASFLGPFAVGLIADMTGNIRLGFVFLLVMLAVPIPILLGVRMGDGRREARDWAMAQAQVRARA